MTTAAQVGRSTINLGKQFKTVIEAGEFLEELGNLEQAITEAKRHATEAESLRTEAQQQYDQMSGELAFAQANLEQVQVDIGKKQQDAVLFNEAVIREAERKAVVIITRATAGAKTIIEQAEAKAKTAQRMHDTLEKVIESQRSKINKLRQQMRILAEGLEVARS